MKNSKIYKYVGKSPDERQRLWENVVRESFRGEAFLFVDKPPVGDPAADSNAPVQLAEQMVKLFDEAQEEVIILSAYLIPSIDEDWLFMHLPIENEM